MIHTFVAIFFVCGATETDYLIIAIWEKLWVKKAIHRGGGEFSESISKCLLDADAWHVMQSAGIK